MEALWITGHLFMSVEEIINGRTLFVQSYARYVWYTRKQSMCSL